jgi:hypothetical protein
MSEIDVFTQDASRWMFVLVLLSVAWCSWPLARICASKSTIAIINATERTVVLHDAATTCIATVVLVHHCAVKCRPSPKRLGTA